MKQSIIFMLALVLTLSLALAVSADDRNICDFTGLSSGDSLWKPGENIRGVFIGEHNISGDENGELFECLEVGGRRLDVDLTRSVTADFKTPLELTDYRTFAVDLWAKSYEDDPDAAYYAVITLHSSDGTVVEDISAITPDSWSRADVDIGTWRGRSSVVSVKIALMVSSTVDGYYAHSFFVDSLAAVDEINHSMTERFMFDRFDITGGQCVTNTRFIAVSISETEPTVISADLFTADTDWETDSLRLDLLAEGIDSLTVAYTTYDNPSISEEKIVNVELIPDSTRRSYFVKVGERDKLGSIKITLPPGKGWIELYSISTVSTHESEKYTTCGSLTSCQFGTALDSIRFIGEVGRDEALGNQSGHIAIYAIEPGSGFDNTMLVGRTPIAESPMTTKFDLTVSLEGRPELTGARFVALSIRSDGTMALIAPPFHLEDPERLATLETTSEIGAKGVICEDISLVSEIEADATMLELDAREVFDSRLTGSDYLYGGEVYYFDENLLSKLDRETAALKAAGVTAMLRLTGWSDRFADLLDKSYAAEGIDYSNYNTAPDGDNYLAALAALIAERYVADRRVSGIILGETMNFLGSSSGNSVNITELARQAARDLRILHTAVKTASASARVYLSISDLYSADMSSYDPELGARDFLPAICSTIRAQGSFEFGLCIELFYHDSTDGDVYIDFGHCDDLIAILRESGVYDAKLIFNDFYYRSSKPKLSDMIPRMVQGYYTAYFTNYVDSYFICLPSGTNQSKSFADLVLAIDTKTDDTTPETSATLALNTLGIKSWKELIPSYDSRRLVYKTHITVDALASEPQGIKGQYEYFSLDSFAQDAGTAVGFYLDSVELSGASEPVLSLKLDRTGVGEVKSMGVIHRFKYSETLRPTPKLALELGLELDNGSPLNPIGATVTFFSDNAKYSVRCELIPGELSTIYADIGEFSSLDDIEGISIRLDGKSAERATLKIARITGLSTEYNDESLAQVIAEERARKRATTEERDYVNYLWVGGGILVGVATVITFALLSRRREDADESDDTE